MTITPDQQAIATSQTLNWRNCWYPITFRQDLPKNRPYSFSFYDENLVLFINQDGKLGCLVDRCPHRAARLSDGQIFDGRIECLYHGWQFATDGQCLHIPQLPQDTKIPTYACVKSYAVVERQGIIWMWAGEAEAADEKSIPILPEFDDPEFVIITDFMSDRPYDQTYVLENLFDPAHIPTSHDGSEGNRQNAQPLEIQILETSIEGIRGRYRNTRNPNENWVNLDFIAPNSVIYRLPDFPKPGLYVGLVIYSLPLGKGRCRVVSRYYGNFSTWKTKLQPRWFSHLYRNRVIEEELPMIAGEQAQIEKLGRNLKDVYLPLKTSDVYVIEYRKWLDKFATSFPFYQGYSTSRLDVVAQTENTSHSLFERFDRHTKICSSCNRAYQVTNLVKQTLVGVAIALAALAILTNDSWISPVAVVASLSALGLAFAAHKVKNKFEISYNSSRLGCGRS
jgi:phenylpropionate dioxygenase-like ring-hydroxylating dioxygenase large terminal subunit